MIFTHIFRYLDDRDAEELRRSSSGDLNTPATNLRYQNSASHWEHRDVRFQKISVKAPAGKVLKTPHKDRETAQGFACLRAPNSRSCQKPRALPPIRGSQITGGEKTIPVHNHNLTKLPPIDLYVSQPTEKEKRSRSRTVKNIWLKCADGAESSCENQQCSSSLHLRDHEEADHLSKEEKLAALKSCSLQDISMAKSCIKKDYQEVFKQTATQHDSKARTDVKSAKTNGIIAGENCTQRPNSVGDQVRSSKEWEMMSEYKKKKTVNDFYKLGKPSELNRTEILTFSAKRNRENANTRNTQDGEYSHKESEQTAFHGDGCLATTNFKKMVNLEDFESADFERGRRNAICEVLEQSIAPPFGSSLYEMRQNLIQLS